MPLNYKINTRTYIIYKFFNTLFFGISVGSYVVQFQPIRMADFPVMGAIFSLLSIPIALLYKKIMKINYFYKFSLLVECIMILWIIMFLIDPWSSDNSLRNS